VFQARAVVLVEAARAWGLDRGLSQAVGRWRRLGARHDPGKVVLDRAVALVVGGDCLADIAVLRSEPRVFGPVASDPTVSCTITTLSADAPLALAAIRTARAAARCSSSTTLSRWSSRRSSPVPLPAAVTEEHGWRLGRIVDPFGREGEIGHPTGSWPPDR